MTTYRMSSVGSCPRIICAERLMYDRPSLTENDRRRLDYYTWCEEMAVRQMEAEGLVVDRAGKCGICSDRDGHHVEIHETLFDLVGHMDGKVILPDVSELPVEIKSIGRFMLPKFLKEGFSAFPVYAGQVLCYMRASGSPLLYWVLCRDTGEYHKFVVGGDVPGFQTLELPFTYEDLVDKLNEVELAVQEETLIEGIESSECRYCDYRYLCIKEEKQVDEVIIPSLVEAAQMYREGSVMAKTGDEMKSVGKSALVIHARDNELGKFRVGGVSVTYRGQKTREFADLKLVRELVDEETQRLIIRKSEPYDDATITVLKEKD